MDSYGLYIHIPFCKKKCRYCDFPSYDHIEYVIPSYIHALQKEIKLIVLEYPNIKLKSIFIGGGTPTYMDSRYIKEIMETVGTYFTIEKDAEISIEGNPGTFDFKKLVDYRKAGINRLSMGLQAWQNDLLKKLGRIHTQEEFLKSFEAVKDVGFLNINIDLMFGLPNQSLEDWKETLDKVTALKPNHLSCYSLIVEKGTPFYKMQNQGNLFLDEDLERQMYYYTKNYLKSKGYHHYEISNFSKPGFECKHNLIYWEMAPYIGVGAAAHSFTKNFRYANTQSVFKYIELLEKNILPIIDKNKETQEYFMQEFMFLGMRKIKGVSQKKFYNLFGKSIHEVYGDVLKNLEDKQLIMIGENISLTAKGLDFANYVFRSFL